MTIEKALEILHLMHVFNTDSDEEREALTMAMEELKKKGQEAENG